MVRITNIGKFKRITPLIAAVLMFTAVTAALSCFIGGPVHKKTNFKTLFRSMLCPSYPGIIEESRETQIFSNKTLFLFYRFFITVPRRIYLLKSSTLFLYLQIMKSPSYFQTRFRISFSLRGP